jgi:hypothetical protein
MSMSGGRTARTGGTVQGTAVDAGEELRPPNGVTISVVAAATVEGTVQRAAFLTTGRIVGAIEFSDRTGATGTCSAIQWLMEPTSGIFGGLGLASWRSRR